MTNVTALERILRRDRVVVSISLALVTALCWVYLVDMAIDMGAMPVTNDALNGDMASMEGSDTKDAMSSSEIASTDGSESGVTDMVTVWSRLGVG